VRSALRAAATLLVHPRFEVIPSPSIEEKVLEWVPRDVTITVTASPSKGLEASFELIEKLSAHGYRVVPHVAARQIVDAVHLEEIAARLLACGVEDIFVPAGDADPPAGIYDRFARTSVYARWHHRAPRKPPQHLRRSDGPGHVGQAPLRDLHREQSLL